MAAHIALKTKAFMGSHTVVNPSSSTGHRSVAEGNSISPAPVKGHRTTKNFQPANPNPDTSGPPAQTSTVNLPGQPIKSGSGDPVGGIK